MVGLIGGRSSIPSEDMLDVMNYEPWYELETVSNDAHEFSVLHHGEKDPDGAIVSEDGQRIGAIQGVLTNGTSRDGGFSDIVDRLLESPASTLSELEGSFVLACSDGDKLVMAVDKLGTKSCYYTPNVPTAFGSDLAALLEVVDSPEVNPQAVGDLLAFTFIPGRKTLIEDVVSLPAGSYLRVDGDEVTVERYFDFEFRPQSDEYVTRVLDEYRTAIHGACETLPTDAETGMWLSGGLDSRLLAGVLSMEFDEFRTYTFDANPGGGENLLPAWKTAALLDLPNNQSRFTPDAFASTIEQAVRLSDGNLPWMHYHNMPFTLNELHRHVDVMMEITGQGELFGEDLLVDSLRSDKSATQVFLEQYALQDAEEVNAILNTPVSLVDSIKPSVKASRFEDSRRRALDTVYREFYPEFHYRTRFYESKVALRAPLSNGPLLNRAINQPDRYRRQRIPYTFVLNMAVSELKLELIRAVDNGLESIPYERTGVSPRRSIWVHTLSEQYKNVKQMFDGSSPMYAKWYRENDALRRAVDGWLDDAKERPIFDANAIEERRRQHLAEEKNNIQSLSVVSTVEIWLQNFVDGRR